MLLDTSFYYYTHRIQSPVSSEMHVHKNLSQEDDEEEEHLISPASEPKTDDTGLPNSIKLIIGAGGIYGAFLYYGSLQEDVFRYEAEDGTSFKQAWFLSVAEAVANVIVGYIGLTITGGTKGLPLAMFGISGAAQVTGKACKALALANGLSFPVATLAKSGKMAPVSYIYIYIHMYHFID